MSGYLDSRYGLVAIFTRRHILKRRVKRYSNCASRNEALMRPLINAYVAAAVMTQLYKWLDI